MKNYLTIILTLLATALLAQYPEDKEQLIAAINADVSNKKTVGITIGRANLEGDKWTVQAGVTDWDKKEAFTNKTLVRIASISKPITGVAIMQLVEQGKVSLDDVVSGYIPAFAKGNKSTITIKHLIQHTSGIAGYKGKESRNKKQYDTLDDAINIFIDRKLKFEPGSAFGYTTYGYVVLGKIIEVASGISYAEYLQENIFAKASMNNTTIESSQTKSIQATVYHKGKRDKIKKIKQHNISNRIPGGGILSTADDLLCFGIALLSHQLISEESLSLMMINHGLKKEGNGYGMAWYLYGEHNHFGNVIGHNGAQYGCSSMLFLLPDSGIVTVALSNTSRYGEVFPYANAAFSIED